MAAVVMSMWAGQCLVVARLDIPTSSARSVSERLCFLSPRGDLSRPLGQRHDAYLGTAEHECTWNFQIYRSS